MVAALPSYGERLHPGLHPASLLPRPKDTDAIVKLKQDEIELTRKERGGQFRAPKRNIHVGEDITLVLKNMFA